MFDFSFFFFFQAEDGIRDFHVTGVQTCALPISVRIEASSGLGDKDIDKMVKDAEAHAAEDKRRREEIERRNRLDTLVYEVEKNSKEWSDKLDASLKSRLDKAVEGAKQALRSGSADEISRALDELQQA